MINFPFIYNYSMVGGYFNMPSARMPNRERSPVGAAIVKPYDIYGVNFQMFDRLEFSLNYRVYKGIVERNFGHEGFGDDAEQDRQCQARICSPPRMAFPILPELSIGAEDFIGTKRFQCKICRCNKRVSRLEPRVFSGLWQRTDKKIFWRHRMESISSSSCADFERHFFSRGIRRH